MAEAAAAATAGHDDSPAGAGCHEMSWSATGAPVPYHRAAPDPDPGSGVARSGQSPLRLRSGQAPDAPFVAAPDGATCPGPRSGERKSGDQRRPARLPW